MKFCSHCGSEINENAVVCIKCGCAVGNIKYYNPYDSSSKGFAVLGFFFPLVGLIMFLVWNNSSPKKAKSCGIGALLGVLIFPILTFLTIFFVTTSVVSYNVLNTGGRSQPIPPVHSPYVDTRTTYKFFTLIGSIRTTTSDPVPYTVLINLHLGYDENDNATATELTARIPELQEFIRTYIRTKRARDLAPENEARLRQEIMEQINTRILSTARIRHVAIIQLDLIQVP